jgi:predicted transcriptional regulator
MANTKLRGIRMDDELWRSIGSVAKELDRDASWCTRKAIEEYIERHKAAKKAARLAASK